MQDLERAGRFRTLLSTSGSAHRRPRRRPISIAEILETRTLLSAITAVATSADKTASDALQAALSGLAPAPVASNDSYIVSTGGTLDVRDGNVVFADRQQINPTSVTGDNGEKPQSKVWQQGGSWWAVFSDSNSTNVWRLDGNTWVSILDLSNRSSVKADVKVVGDLVHVLMHSSSATELRTVQFAPGSGGTPNTYQFWSTQPNLVTLPSMASLETVTLDVDSTGRMWVAYERSNQVRVRHSSGPYTSWSEEISLATGLNSDDIAAVIALPDGRIGVFWSSQGADRFGFRTHLDGTDPTSWTANEVPASQSALNVGSGMADDHIHIAVKSDSTVYVAVKTSYNSSSAPRLMLLVRRPNGTWDNNYDIDLDRTGTRPNVQLSDIDGGLIYSYRNTDSNGPIQFRELTDTGSNILIGPEQTLLSGSSFNNISGSKANITDEAVFIAAGGGTLTGVRLPYRYGVLSNDHDVNGDILTATLVTPPLHGTLSLNPNGTFTYVHNGDTASSDSFTYFATDGLGNSNIATVSIAINPAAGGPEVTVLGNGANIADGDTTPAAADFTDFGSILQGGSAVSRTFTVRNDGTSALNLSALSVPTGFTITDNLVSSLAAGASDTFTVRLDTATVGTKSGQVSFTTNDSNENPFNFDITGTISATSAPEITVLGNLVNIVDGDSSPSASDFTDFGSATQGGPVISRSFTVRNDGTAALNLSALAAPTGFTITDGLVASLAAGESDTFTIQLDTTTVGAKSGQISFTTNDSDENPFNFSIAGTVTPISGGTTTVSFQDGVDGYAGTIDAHIRGDQLTKNYETATALQMHGNPDKASLIRWNVSTIPANAVVQSASITVDVTNETNQAFEIYGLLRSWVENQVTWTVAATGNNWATAGAQGASDRGTTVLGSITAPTNGLVTINLNAAGIAQVQSWISNPATNNGIVIQDYAATDGLDISSSEIAAITSRPKLTITYGMESTLLAASDPDVTFTGAPLTGRSLYTIVDAVAERWLAAAPSESRATLRTALNTITFAVADLPGRVLGTSFGSTILIDRDAAGFGWFIDPSPDNDREFTAWGIASQATAAGRVDLVTAVAHEVGHAIGFEHNDGGLMSDKLATGQRKGIPDVEAVEIDRIFESFAATSTPLMNFP